MVFGAVTSAALCIVQSFANSYPAFLVFELLSSTVHGGIYTVAFVLGKIYRYVVKLLYDANGREKKKIAIVVVVLYVATTCDEYIKIAFEN